ncbi:MAG TPA: hypothetical protein VE397_12490 [Stellaceae bacterium]|nr:hypothetical protein [Stellaceae bacterium]
MEIDSDAAKATQTTSCDQAAGAVRGVYEDTLALRLSMQPALLTMAMHLGERCKQIAQEDDNTLMQAWLKLGNSVTQHYNASIRARYVLHVVAAEGEADKLPCSDARRTIDSALVLARQVLKN